MKHVEIDALVGHVQLEAGSGELWLTFQCRDIDGTVRNAAISPYAVQQLHEALHEGMLTLLNPLMDKEGSTYVEMSVPDNTRETV